MRICEPSSNSTVPFKFGYTQSPYMSHNGRYVSVVVRRKY